MPKKRTSKSLENKIAVVAGATRGAGRGIACMLGEAGATVYCTGRSARGYPPTGIYAGRTETIEETAEMVTQYGGNGIPVRTDHLVEEEVAALFQRVQRDHRRLDVLVNDISEGEAHDWKPFWEVSLEKGFRALRQGINSHITTSYYAIPLMIKTRGGLIVEIGDGGSLGYRGNFFYDLVKISVNRIAYDLSLELHKCFRSNLDTNDSGLNFRFFQWKMPPLKDFSVSHLTRLDLNHPPTAVGGIGDFRNLPECRLD